MAHGAGVTVGQGDGAAVLGRLVDGFDDGNDDGAEESDGARLGAVESASSFRTSFSNRRASTNAIAESTHPPADPRPSARARSKDPQARGTAELGHEAAAPDLAVCAVIN